MKKIFYLLSSLMLVFTACDPMEDVYEELDKAAAPKRTLAIKLQDADYKDLKDAPANVKTGLYFSSETQAGEFIPTILNKKYAHLNNNDVIDVTYNKSTYEGLTGIVTATDKKDYTVTEEDYRALGKTDGKLNFNSASDIPKFFTYKYTAPVEGQVVVLTYDYFAGAVRTLTDAFYYKNGAWVKAYYVTKADYTALGKNADFSSSDDNLLDDYFNMFLERTVFGPQAGSTYYVSYAYYNSSTRKTEQRIMTMAFNGTRWITVAPTVTTEAMLSFKKKQGVWVPDPIIKYTLVEADYVWIGDNPALGTVDNRANLKQFKSFYQRFSDDSRYWTEAQVITALGALLKDRFPNAEVGNKFEVTYVVHTGPTGPTSRVLELKESGEYELVVD